ncbi:MAG: hypothetical protein INH41_04515 [Myxococcaceae bacterium]|nr:hypothetical protein [Myxococcaceae bacterium]MCA3011647.1 hypothetical protein [Myxococcaceae bacterium]
MLDFCAHHGFGADVEVIKAADINGAYERMVKHDVKCRFVIDAKMFWRMPALPTRVVLRIA